MRRTSSLIGGSFKEGATLRDEAYSTLLPLPPRLEAVCPPDPKILRFILELLHPDEWGKHRKIDVPHKSGVLVVGYITKKPEYCTAASVKAKGSGSARGGFGRQ
jgi:hypothetical protein